MDATAKANILALKEEALQIVDTQGDELVRAIARLKA